MADKAKLENEKTNVMRILDSKKIKYNSYCYVETGETNGEKVAAILGQNPDCVFKTLVTVGKTGTNYVFVIPVNKELDLKKAAKSVGEKSIQMLAAKELLPLTGYIHGGCSPIGMKKFFKTTVHETARECDSIYFSAGKVGYQVNVTSDDLARVIKFQFADVIA
ncbi:MAG: Cys-tRNA(Pro) deacylase [Lachnospiraceae bacterium]|nr:Cys-tRNA(Pro) deacylase [Lachnospiraceae bacterium]